MSIWGKIIGAGTGFAVGGPLGALLGGVAGHVVDKVRDQVAGTEGGAVHGVFGGYAEQARQSAFAVATIALAAKMAKADGHVTPNEIRAFKQLFRIPKESEASVAKLYNMAKQSAEGYETYARQVANLFVDSPEVLEELLDVLFAIAMADGVLHPNEEAFLRRVAVIFGMPDKVFERVRAGQRSFRSSASAVEDAYAVLGVPRSASDADIRAVYRKLIKEHHPDALMAKGMPEDFIAVANQKMAAINAAYDTIEKARGM